MGDYLIRHGRSPTFEQASLCRHIEYPQCIYLYHIYWIQCINCDFVNMNKQTKQKVEDFLSYPVSGNQKIYGSAQACLTTVGSVLSIQYFKLFSEHHVSLEEDNIKKCNLTLAMSPRCLSNRPLPILLINMQIKRCIIMPLSRLIFGQVHMSTGTVIVSEVRIIV